MAPDQWQQIKKSNGVILTLKRNFFLFPGKARYLHRQYNDNNPVSLYLKGTIKRSRTFETWGNYESKEFFYKLDSLSHFCYSWFVIA